MDAVFQKNVEQYVAELLNKKNVEKAAKKTARDLIWQYRSEIKRLFKAGCSVEEICSVMAKAGVVLDRSYVNQMELELENWTYTLDFIKAIFVAVLLSTIIVALVLISTHR